MPKVDAIAEELVETMPEPQEHAIKAEQEKEKLVFDEHLATTSNLVDRLGRSFDPALHTVDGDGNPKINQNGTLRIKRGRGSPGAKSTLGEIKRDISATSAGKTIADSIFALGQLLGGEEWAPMLDHERGVDERKSMTDAWSRYADENDWNDIPPGVVVIIVTIGYIAPRLFMPKTKARMSGIREWIGAKYLALKNRGK